jgi:hypothetical protein
VRQSLRASSGPYENVGLRCANVRGCRGAVRENVRLRCADSAARSQRSVGGIDRPVETQRGKLILCEVSHRPQLKSSIDRRGVTVRTARVGRAMRTGVGTPRRGRPARFSAAGRTTARKRRNGRRKTCADLNWRPRACSWLRMDPWKGKDKNYRPETCSSLRSGV